MNHSKIALASLSSILVFLTLAGSAFARTDPSIHISTNCWGNHEYEDSGPTLLVKNMKGRVIHKGGHVPRRINIEVKSSVGIESIEITKGAPLIDSEHNMGSGCGAAYVFNDPTTFGSSNTYHVDLGKLKQNTPLFIQAFDSKGGVSIQGFLFNENEK